MPHSVHRFGAVLTLLCIAAAAGAAGIRAAPLAAQSLPPFDIGGVYNASGYVFAVNLYGMAIRELGTTDPDAGGGFGVRLGYGFTDHFGLSAQASVGTMTYSPHAARAHPFFQVDLGTRVLLLPGRSTVPYLEAAVSARRYSLPWGFADELNVRGGALTGGAGFEFFVARAVAVELGVAVTHGTFVQGRHPGGTWETLDGGSIAATSGRAGLGLVWHP